MAGVSLLVFHWLLYEFIGQFFGTYICKCIISIFCIIEPLYICCVIVVYSRSTWIDLQQLYLPIFGYINLAVITGIQLSLIHTRWNIGELYMKWFIRWLKTCLYITTRFSDSWTLKHKVRWNGSMSAGIDIGNSNLKSRLPFSRNKLC